VQHALEQLTVRLDEFCTAQTEPPESRSESPAWTPRSYPWDSCSKVLDDEAEADMVAIINQELGDVVVVKGGERQYL
jgi:hypothetical protein